ncbi:MAG: ROK family protein [Spirochaetaceae bacterium]
MNIVNNRPIKLLALDMGGTRIKMGLVSNGEVKGLKIIPSLSHLPFSERLGMLKDDLIQICSQESTTMEELDGLAIAFPAIINYEKNEIIDNYDKYPGSAGFDLTGWAKSELGLKVAIDNDARCALLGEVNFGAGRGNKSSVMLTLGTGIGSSAYVNGEIIRGNSGLGGCLMGHQTLNISGDLCYCGNIGCAELETSIKTVVQRIKNSRHFENSPLKDIRDIDYEILFNLFESGDLCATKIINYSLKIWGALAVSIIHSFDPAILILGGGIMNSGKFIIPSIKEYINIHSRNNDESITIKAAELGDRAALLGCQVILEGKL